MTAQVQIGIKSCDMKKLLILLLFATLTNIVKAQYAVNVSQHYNLNTGFSRMVDPVNALFDGDVKTSISSGYGALMSEDDYWLLTKGLVVDSIRLYSNTGNKSNAPFIITAWYNGKETPLAAFNAGMNGYITYREAPGTKADKIHIATTAVQTIWPTEMVIYSKSKPVRIKYYPLPKRFLDDEIGINSFPWSWAKGDNSLQLIPGIFNTFDGYTSARVYIDFDWFEATQGIDTFNPMHSGGWPLDVIQDSLKAHGITTLLDFKCQPAWMAKTWSPINDQNKPMMYGADPLQPVSYKAQARTAFQIAARYGQTQVSAGLLTIDASPRWAGDFINIKRTGLGSLHYIENNNENDRWWQGMTAYQTAWQEAANQSAFYDGDLGKLGPGYGVKTADPLMQVSVPGICNVYPDVIMGMYDWCNMYRGGKLCWDIINYHLYAGTVQPEGTIDVQLAPVIQVARQFNQPLWVTETGYDDVKGSPTAPAGGIGSKTIAQVKADWILRTVLLNARIGVSRTFIYQDYDLAPGNAGQFATSGVIGKISGAYLQQVSKLMKGYYYLRSRDDNGLYVDVYTSNGTNRIFVLWSPTSTGKTVNYSFKNGTLYTPGATAMGTQAINNKMVAVSETPVFLQTSAK